MLKTAENPTLGSTVAGTGPPLAGVQPVSTILELAMHLIPILAASAFLLAGTEVAVAASSTRIAETGAFLLGNAHRCGVADERVVRAGKVIRALIVAASDDAGQQMVAKSRFAEIFRASARPADDGHAVIPPCKTVLTQFERLEQFRDHAGLR
jgi:hypothetical protein